MAERALARKSQLFLHSVLPVVDTHDQVVKKKFKRGKYVLTHTGLIKIFALVFLLIGLVLFVAIPTCDNVPDWYPYLFPFATGITLLIGFSLFMVFSLGLVTNHPGRWVKIDIISSLLLAIFTLACTITSMDSCKIQTTLHKVPEPLAIVGSALLIIGCASLFLLYRYKEDELERPQVVQAPETRAAEPPRKSIFI